MVVYLQMMMEVDDLEYSEVLSSDVFRRCKVLNRWRGLFLL